MIETLRARLSQIGSTITNMRVLQTKKWKPSDDPPKISIDISCVIFQGGSLLITQSRGVTMEFYEFHHNNHKFCASK